MQLGHQAAQCTVGTVDWRQMYGEDVFKLKKAVFQSDIEALKKAKEINFAELEKRARDYAKVKPSGGFSNQGFAGRTRLCWSSVKMWRTLENVDATVHGGPVYCKVKTLLTLLRSRPCCRCVPSLLVNHTTTLQKRPSRCFLRDRKKELHLQQQLHHSNNPVRCMVHKLQVPFVVCEGFNDSTEQQR